MLNDIDLSIYREITLEEHKTLSLNVLLVVDAFCKRNNLKYYLAYGTLIGAIRHKGFIPWDDDIDVNMSRKDYIYLTENFNRQNSNGRYKLITPYSEESRHSFVKIIDTQTLKIEKGVEYIDKPLGVDIDIFPLDGQPVSEHEFNKWYKKLHKVYKWFAYNIMDYKLSLKRRVCVPILRILSGGKIHILKKAEKLHKKYQYEDSDYIGCIESMYNSNKNRFKKEWFSTTIEVMFEGYKLSAPNGYDKILKKLYGNYMELPPKEQQETHHNNKVFIKKEIEKYEKI